jgi:hypothetical protein
LPQNCPASKRGIPDSWGSDLILAEDTAPIN